MTEAIDQLARAERRRLVQQLREHRRETGEAPAQAAIPRQGGAGPYPLSFAQQRLWFLDQLEPGLVAYNISRALRLTGRLDLRALRRSLQEVVQRHESLRTTFVLVAGEPAQVISPPASIALPVIDLSDLPAAVREATVLRLVAAEVRRPFDLARGPLLRTVLFRLAPDRWTALFAMHHIISDGWSLGLFIRELAHFYNGFASGSHPSLPELPIQYGDFARWQRQRLEGAALEEQIDYWRRRLRGPLPSLVLPADHPYPAVRTHRGAHLGVSFPAAFSEGLRELGRRRGATLFMTLLAAIATQFHRYTGEADILIGSPVTHRNRMETEGLIGFFVNTVVLRIDLSGDPAFLDLVERVRETALGAYTHQDLPFERLVEELHPERDLSRHPIFQVLVALENAPMAPLTLPELTLGSIPTEIGSARVDVGLEFRDAPHGLQGSAEYSTELFEKNSLERLVVHLGRLIQGVAASPEHRISDLPLLDEGERHQIVLDWNDTRRDLAEDGLHQLVARQAARAPEALAAVSDQARLTYGELHRRAVRLAHRLRGLGVTAESRVAVCVERSPEALIALLGVLQSGGAYVPLDPETPSERLAGLMADAGARVLVTQRPLEPRLSTLPGRVLLVDSEDGVSGPSLNPFPVAPDNAAYVVYTSGSSGVPKGVVATHRGTVNFVHAVTGALGLGPADRLLLFAPLSFDASVLQIFSTLASGAALVLHPHPRELAARDILDLCARHGVTVLDLPAALWRQWVEEVAAFRLPLPGSLRLFLTGGESVPVARLETWMGLAGRPVSFLSSYGPTEATVTTTVWQTTSTAVVPTATHVPIGRPLPNTRVYVLDRKLRPVPRGVAGELFLGGAGLARGYLGRPDLTARAFVPDPLSGEPGARLYRTGDLGRHRPDGDLEFLGRADHQVKIRGFRVELEEIEAALTRSPDVRQAVVTVREDAPGDQRLVGYVVAREGRQVHPGELRAFLSRLLPAYMIPSTFVPLAELPVLPSGKLDRAALPAPASTRSELSASFVAPRDPLEQILAEIWAQVLKVEQVGAFDNFFELGGHSLIATQVLTRIRQVFDVDFQLRSLFEEPTIASLAEILRRSEDGEKVVQTAALRVELASLSDEEVRALLLAEATAEKGLEP